MKNLPDLSANGYPAIPVDSPEAIIAACDDLRALLPGMDPTVVFLFRCVYSLASLLADLAEPG